MFDLQINFSHPWLMLLIIPAVALTLIPYFRLSKKFRKTRNRVSSVVLHLIAIVLCISVLAGMRFDYKVYNSQNEIMLVVDMSYSTQEEKEAKDEFVGNVIAMTNTDIYSLGIVTFGYKPQLVVPLTNDLGGAYNQYLNAAGPDTSASDIASALVYAREQFNFPESAKIVLISDGVETDEKAESVIESIVADHTRIDTVSCKTLTAENEVQAIKAEIPSFNILPEEVFDITFTVVSSCKEDTPANVVLFDNDVECANIPVKLKKGEQDIVIPHTFKETGLHTLRFEITSDTDAIKENNSLYAYRYLEVFDKVLVVESVAGQSEKLIGLLADCNVKVVHVGGEDMPSTLDELRAYDEIILNNIANGDLPEGWDILLEQYVYNVGGGLFTVGGSEDGNPEVAHAYNREDMAGTLLQQMLPVQAIDYTPPLGMIIIIDVSGSMDSGTNVGTVTKLDAAKDAAVSLVRDYTCLTERDYCGIMTLSDNYTEDVVPLPMTRQDEILSAIYNIEKGSSTVFTSAINHAGMALRALYTGGRVEKMHAVVISDGGAADYETYIDRVEHFNKLGVTFSFIAVEADGDSMEQLKEAARVGGGKAYNASAANLTSTLKDDIRLPAIKEVEYGEFVPTLNGDSFYASVITQQEMPSLFGFYGTKARTDAEIVLAGKYNVPIYAQWKYGKGTVGSFTCDLNGVWSSDFLDTGGKGPELLVSIVNKLFPTENIRPKNLNVVLREENYNTQISIYPVGDLAEGESVEMRLESISNPNANVWLVTPTAEEKYSRGSLMALDAGVYRITTQRMDSNSQAIGNPVVIYKTFSYSEEFNVLYERVNGKEVLQLVALLGSGTAEDLSTIDPISVFQGFKESNPGRFDPVILFMILAIVCFLLDIAVRKFKFKWPHELIREYREKKKDK